MSEGDAGRDRPRRVIPSPVVDRLRAYTPMGWYGRVGDKFLIGHPDGRVDVFPYEQLEEESETW